MPVQPIDISNTSGQMFLDDESVFAPRERGLERQAKQNALARQMAVRNALAQSINPQTGQTNWQFARQMGGVDVAPELQAAQQEDFGRLTKEDTDYLANMRGQLEMYVNDQPSYDAWVAQVKTRHPYANFPEKFSPEVKNELSGFSRKLEMAGRTGLYNPLTAAEEQALGLPPNVVAQRGPQGKVSVVYKPPAPKAPSGAGVGRAPSGYRYKQDGTLEAIPGGPADKSRVTPAAGAKVSEQQAAYHGKRILDAAAQIAAAAKNAPSANRPSALEATVSATPGLRNIVGAVRSAPRQIVSAAQREMLDALLYLATGAAYNKEQLEGEIESTLPAYFDKPETVRAKRDRLRKKIDAAKIRAGSAWTPEMDAALAVLDANASASGTPAANAPTNGVDHSNPLLGGKP